MSIYTLGHGRKFQKKCSQPFAECTTYIGISTGLQIGVAAEHRPVMCPAAPSSFSDYAIQTVAKSHSYKT